jgi:hypothetical protein
MGGEGSGGKPSKPNFLVRQRDLFASLLKCDSEPPQEQQCLGAATTSQALSEFIKLAKLALTVVGTIVNDERALSAMSFVKTPEKNGLDKHLELAVRAKYQGQFTFQKIPTDEALQEWQRGAGVRGRYMALVHDQYCKTPNRQGLCCFRLFLRNRWILSSFRTFIGQDRSLFKKKHQVIGLRPMKLFSVQFENKSADEHCLRAQVQARPASQ